jgi:ArsR family transcriptional regulator
MKAKKRENFERELAIKFKALAHPARVKLVKDLMKKDCCVGEIQKCLSISQPNVSQHLKVLKRAGIIEGRREKTKICYRIADEAIKKAITILTGE